MPPKYKYCRISPEEFERLSAGIPDYDGPDLELIKAKMRAAEQREIDAGLLAPEGED